MLIIIFVVVVVVQSAILNFCFNSLYSLQMLNLNCRIEQNVLHPLYDHSNLSKVNHMNLLKFN